MTRMKHLLCVFLVAALGSFSFKANAYTERNMLQKAADETTLKNVLIMKQAWVPYPAYIDRAAWDSLMGPNKQRLIEAGEKLLDYKWQLIPATAYLEYERSGNRKIMEVPYDANRQALNALMLAELAEGKGRFIDQLLNGAYMSCEMNSWVLSAHLPRQSSKRSLPDFREQIIDLGSGGYGALMAWVHYFFRKPFDKINPVVSLQMRKAIKERILDPYMNDDEMWWMAFNWKPGEIINNWNPWCNSNALQCFLLMENNKDKLAKAVYRSMQSVDKFINFVKSDGACEEGTSYWGHAAGKLYDYLQILSDGTGGKLSLFNEPMIRRMGEYMSRSYVGNGWEPILNETWYPADFAQNVKNIVMEEYPYPYCYTGCDSEAKGHEYFPVLFKHPQLGGVDKEEAEHPEITYFTREWGDNVDDWSSHNSPSRASRAWGETPMLIQAQGYANPSYPYTCYEM